MSFQHQDSAQVDFTPGEISWEVGYLPKFDPLSNPFQVQTILKQEEKSLKKKSVHCNATHTRLVL